VEGQDGNDGQTLANAVYDRLDKHLRAERREWVLAFLAAVGIFGSALLVLYATTGTGPEQRVHGTVLRTVQGADDSEHVVYLAVALENGQTVSVRQGQVLPIGATVTLSHRKNWFDTDTYELIDQPAPPLVASAPKVVDR